MAIFRVYADGGEFAGLEGTRVNQITMIVHALKTWPEFFQPIQDGTKTFEVRLDDREFKVGDILRLDEYDQIKKNYTGPIFYKKISYILKGGQFGIQRGYVVLGLDHRGISPADVDYLHEKGINLPFRNEPKHHTV